MAPPKESDSLLASSYRPHLSMIQQDDTSSTTNGDESSDDDKHRRRTQLATIVGAATLMIVGALLWNYHKDGNNGGGGSSSNSTPFFRHKKTATTNFTGPYQLLEVHHGKHSFFDHYNFFQGPDSLGSAGYQTYVSRQRATELGLLDAIVTDTEDDNDNDDYVFMKSAAGTTTAARDEHGNRFRESIRLEGKTRFDRGLLILDVQHMPAGCGVWPAFWTTDETNWPDHGEIDILEGINNQDVVKTALHTTEHCSMYAHVPRWSWSGQWDTATGLPDTFTGQPNYDNAVQADDCYVLAPHQWANQGCVAVSQENGTIGTAMNDNYDNGGGGGAYVLEWDPANGYIRSWVFKHGVNMPQNLLQSMASADNDNDDNDESVVPDPSTWGLPYAYFAIGDGSGCSADHFQNHHIVINLAFCGTVSGNRFQHDCPALFEQYNVHNDSVLTCNAYIDSNPQALDEAYWKIRGVYLYQRG